MIPPEQEARLALLNQMVRPMNEAEEKLRKLLMTLFIGHSSGHRTVIDCVHILLDWLGIAAAHDGLTLEEFELREAALKFLRKQDRMSVREYKNATTVRSQPKKRRTS